MRSTKTRALLKKFLLSATLALTLSGVVVTPPPGPKPFPGEVEPPNVNWNSRY